MSFFNDETIKSLEEPLSKEDVKQRDGTGNTKLSYIASHHAIKEANRIFGFGNWSTEIQHIQMVDKTEYEKKPYNVGDEPKPMISISYTCHIKLTVNSGDKYISHEDIGFGNGVAGNTAYGKGQCIELATKEAVTDSLKRCLRYYGNKFGLSLYDKDDVSVMPMDEIEKAKIVTEDQLDVLRDLYPARDINDEWVLLALKGENCPFNSLELLRFDWYELALQLTTAYKLDEINAANYEADIKRIMKLMGESISFNMLKGLYIEAQQKANAQGDKDRLLEIVKIKDEMKIKFEEKK